MASEPFYTCELPVEVQNYAREVLGESETTRRRGLDELKKWAEENSHLHVRTEEKYLLPFLRVAKFDVDKAKKKLTNFYVMKRDRTEWYENRDPNLGQIQEVVKMGGFVILKKTFENQVVVVIRPMLHNPNLHHLDDIIKGGLMILDVAIMEEELAQIYGVVGIIDMTNLSFAHLKELSPTRIKNIVNSWQNFHCRPQRIQFVNAPSYINVVLDIFKSFMSAKLKNRTFVCHDGYSAVTQLMDKEILPKNYDGVAESLEELGQYWSDKLISYSDWFIQDAEYKAEKKKSKRWFSH